MGWYKIYSENSKELIYITHYNGEVISDPFRHKYDIPVPLYQQAFRFIREKYKIMGIIDYDETDKSYFYYINFMDDMLSINYSKNYQTYEEAELECVINLITIIKEDKDETI